MRRLLIRRAVYTVTATTAGGTAVSTLCEGGDNDEFLAGAAGVFAVSSLATGIYLLYNRLWIDFDESDPDSAALKTKYVDGESRLARWSRNWGAGRYSEAGKSFHQANVNYFLSQYEDRLIDPDAKPGQNVLVPLCGKSVDMVFLATRGHNVVGVEGVHRAVNEFEKDNNLPLTPGEAQGPFTMRSLLGPMKRFIPCKMWLGELTGYIYGRFNVNGGEPLGYMIDRPVHHSKSRRDALPGNIHFAIGDFMDLDQSIVEGRTTNSDASFDACWDRAALVALHPKDREKYVETVHKMLRPGGHVLLVVTEHDPFPHGVLGPPFSIPERTVRELYERDDRFEIEVLERRSRLSEGIAKRANLKFFDEVAYLIRKK